MSERRSFSGEEARNLLRRARTATLGTLNADDGIPYASLVNVATDVRGWPLILVSTLAWHTRNLLADPRASLMVAEVPATGDALTGPRVTVMGRFAKVEDAAVQPPLPGPPPGGGALCRLRRLRLLAHGAGAGPCGGRFRPDRDHSARMRCFPQPMR